MQIDPTEYKDLSKAIAKAFFIIASERKFKDDSDFDHKTAAQLFEEIWELEYDEEVRLKYEQAAGFVIQHVHGEL